MWLRVAALLGGRTVEEWQARMTFDEFRDWCAFYSMEPWGYEIANWRTGVAAATVANFSGRAKKRLNPSDFMPQPPGRSRPMSDKQVRARLAAGIEEARRHET